MNNSINSLDCEVDKGFTLIEMMIVLVILSIFVSIAIPSYRQYVYRNAEYEAKAKMKQLEIQLNSWRATALSYKGFKPQKKAINGTVSYAYDESDNQTIYVPENSTASNYKYKIVLASVVNSTTSSSLITNGSTTIDTDSLAIGRNWSMLAIPNTDALPNAKKILLTSDGIQCKTKNNDTTVTILSANCGSYSEKW